MIISVPFGLNQVLSIWDFFQFPKRSYMVAAILDFKSTKKKDKKNKKK